MSGKRQAKGIKQTKEKCMPKKNEQEVVAWIGRSPQGWLLPWAVSQARKELLNVLCRDLAPANGATLTYTQLRRMGYRVEKCVISTDPDITEVR